MTKLYAAVLNRGAGSIRNRDPSEVVDAVERTFRNAGHEIDVTLADSSSVRREIAARAKRGDIEALIVGGGDGTVSTAARFLQGTDILLGVLPLGTMNLYARSLGVPLEFEAAVAAVASAKPAKADMGFVNGQPFVHQVSFGLQPKLVRLRESMQYGSRWGKILASARAFLIALKRPPRLALNTEIDGKSFSIETPALAITNNLLGVGHLPYADDIDGGVLGVYALTSTHWRDIAQATADAALGNWHANPQIRIFAAAEVALKRAGAPRPIMATVDGELREFRKTVVAKIAPRALNVLVPDLKP